MPSLFHVSIVHNSRHYLQNGNVSFGNQDWIHNNDHIFVLVSDHWRGWIRVQSPHKCCNFDMRNRKTTNVAHAVSVYVSAMMQLRIVVLSSDAIMIHNIYCTTNRAVLDGGGEQGPQVAAIRVRRISGLVAIASNLLSQYQQCLPSTGLAPSQFGSLWSHSV